MIAQTVFDLFLISHVLATFAPMARGVDWAAQDVAQLLQWLDEGRKPREMRALRPDWSLESIKTKIKHLRRGSQDESRPLKRRRTSEVLVEIEVAVTADSERAPSAKFAGNVALDVVARLTRRSPSAVLQARPHRFPAVLHRKGCAHQRRMLHSGAGRRVRLGTGTSSWWWQEDNAPSRTSRRTKAFLKEREIQLLAWPPCSPN